MGDGRGGGGSKVGRELPRAKEGTRKLIKKYVTETTFSDFLMSSYCYSNTSSYGVVIWCITKLNARWIRWWCCRSVGGCLTERAVG